MLPKKTIMKGMVIMKRLKTLLTVCVAVGVLATGTVSAWASGAFNPTAPPETEVAQLPQQANAIQLSRANANAAPLSLSNTNFEILWDDENDRAESFFAEYGDLTLSQAVEQFYSMINSKAEERLSAAIADGTITEEQSKEILSRKTESPTTKLTEGELFNKYKNTTLNELKERFPEIRQEIEALEIDGGEGTIGEQIARFSEMTLGEALDTVKTGMDEKLAAALTDGTITQEQADAIKEKFGDKSFADNELFTEYMDTKLSELVEILPQIMESNLGDTVMNPNGINFANIFEQYGDLTLGEAMEKVTADMPDTQTQLKERLDAAVADGKITQQHADEVLANQAQNNIFDNATFDKYKDVKVSELESILPELMKGVAR